jgi:hypothetical protein
VPLVAIADTCESLIPSVADVPSSLPLLAAVMPLLGVDLGSTILPLFQFGLVVDLERRRAFEERWLRLKHALEQLNFCIATRRC